MNKFKSKDYLKSLFSSKSFKVGSYSTFASVAVIAIAIIAVMIVEKLPSNITKLDISSNKLLSLSDQTKQIAGGLDKDVNIYLIAQTGSENSTIKGLLERYEALSDKIKVSTIDPAVSPNFAKQYTDEKVYVNSVIVSCDKKSRYIPYNEIFETQYNGYDMNSASTSFNGESCITGALDYVTNDNLTKIYKLQGHGEGDLSASFADGINNENIEIDSLNLLTVEKAPDDASAIVIIGPQKDISTQEKDILIKYAEQGGSIVLLSDWTETDLPNLNALTLSFGMEKQNGVICEGDSSKSLKGYSHYIIPDFAAHDVTEPLSSAGYSVVIPAAHGIKNIETLPEGVTVDPLLTTSSQAYLKTAGYNIQTTEKEDGDITAAYTVASAATIEKDGKKGHLVWFGSSQILSDQANQLVSGANLDLFINSIGWSCERENSISIRAKSMDESQLTVSTGAAGRWGLLIVGVLPFGLITAGIYVWSRRRRR